MRIEFSHLYEILKKKNRSEDEIHGAIEKLQQNAALQQNLERQYKQANSNNLKK